MIDNSKILLNTKYQRYFLAEYSSFDEYSDNGKKKPRTKTGYGTAKRARMTLRNIKSLPKSYQRQVVTTMYNRAKYHKYQNQGMRNAMKIYKDWLGKH